MSDNEDLEMEAVGNQEEEMEAVVNKDDEMEALANKDDEMGVIAYKEEQIEAVGLNGLDLTIEEKEINKTLNTTSSNSIVNLEEMGALKLKGITLTKEENKAMNHLWDPLLSIDQESPSTFCLQRLKRDLTSIFTEKNVTFYVAPDENDLTKIHAIISGPPDTPYEGGFFYFFIRVPPTYPLLPPRVKLMTTGHGCVRFNPNLYANGKVCLSTLGTWSGPGWSAANSMLSVLLSIQSLMNEKPYFNEPGYNHERNPGDSDKYNKLLIHETLRVAACGMAEGDFKSVLPASLQELIEKNFLLFHDHYLSVIEMYKHLDGEIFCDPFSFSRNKRKFQFGALEERLTKIVERLMGEGKMTEYDGTESFKTCCQISAVMQA